MASDFLSGLGGIVKGLSGLMPQDDPDVKILNAQTELNGLQKQEKEIYAQVGERVMSQDGAAQFPEEASKLALLRENIAAASKKLNEAQSEKTQKEQAQREALDMRTCPSCGLENAEGVRFCQECGSKLGAMEKCACPNCGAQNPTGTKFCGKCGTKLQGDV